jgi:hypothetical protein
MRDSPSETLETLCAVLGSARRLAQELAERPDLSRLLGVFARMPVQDRPVVLEVLEREVDLRTMAQETPTLAAFQIARPNPNARLYFRVSDGELPPFVSPEEVAQTVIRWAHILSRATAPGLDLEATWGPAMLQGLRTVPRREREILRQYHRTMLTLLDQVDGAATD